MTRIWARIWAPAPVLVVTLLFAVVGFAAPWYASRPQDLAWATTWQLVVGLGCAAAGYAVTAKDRASTPGRLLIIAAVLLFTAPVLSAAGWARPAAALWIAVILVVIPPALLRVAPLRPVPRWRPAVDVALVASGLGTALVVALGQVEIGLVLGTLAALVVLIGGGLLFEATAGDDRRRVLWVILGFMLTVPPSLLLFVAVDGGGTEALVLGLIAATLSLSLPLATAVAVLDPRLLDVRAIIERLTVFTLMFALAAAVYVGAETTILAVTGVEPPRGVRVLVAVAVAALFHPTMRWVRTSVTEMLFGGRADPVDTLTQLGSHLAAGSSPREWLDTLRIALAVQGLALRQDGEVVATSGELDHTVTAVTELRADAEHVGDLVVALPPDHLHPAPTTAAVLSLVAVPLGQALHAARLTEDLRTSRGRVVGALEDERRRIRRDLHDGLGSTLTGIAYSADAAANLLRANPDDAAEILRQLRLDAGEAIAEVRRIVYALRPRALDELGLVGAVQQQVSHLRTADGRVLAVTIDAPPALPDLPAAVEVAAYRVAVEAVTNVARHSGVAEATITFAARPGPVLHIAVRDAGQPGDPWTPGVGLRSMRERVEQIGGHFAAHTSATGSTITAEIPLGLP